MAANKIEIPSSSSGESSAPLCSICLDPAVQNKSLAIAKLKCGHTFHLSCIGCEFNSKGAMQCPNCRDTEHSQWLYCTRNADADEDSEEEAEPADNNPDHQENEVEVYQIDDDDDPVEHFDSPVNLNQTFPIFREISRGIQIAGENNSNNSAGPSTSRIQRQHHGHLPSPAPAPARAARSAPARPRTGRIAPARAARPAPAPAPAARPEPAPPTFYNESDPIIFIDVSDRMRNYLPVVDRADPPGSYYGIENSIVHQNRHTRSLVIFGRNAEPTQPTPPSVGVESPPRWVGHHDHNEEVDFLGLEQSVFNQDREMGSTSDDPLALTMESGSYMSHATFASTSTSTFAFASASASAFASASTSAFVSASGAPNNVTRLLGRPIWAPGHSTGANNPNVNGGRASNRRRRVRLFGIET